MHPAHQPNYASFAPAEPNNIDQQGMRPDAYWHGGPQEQVQGNTMDFQGYRGLVQDVYSAEVNPFDPVYDGRIHNANIGHADHAQAAKYNSDRADAEQEGQQHHGQDQSPQEVAYEPASRQGQHIDAEQPNPAEHRLPVRQASRTPSPAPVRALPSLSKSLSSPVPHSDNIERAQVGGRAKLSKRGSAASNNSGAFAPFKTLTINKSSEASTIRDGDANSSESRGSMMNKSRPPKWVQRTSASAQAELAQEHQDLRGGKRKLDNSNLSSDSIGSTQRSQKKRFIDSAEDIDQQFQAQHAEEQEEEEEGEPFDLRAEVSTFGTRNRSQAGYRSPFTTGKRSLSSRGRNCRRRTWNSFEVS